MKHGCELSGQTLYLFFQDGIVKFSRPMLLYEKVILVKNVINALFVSTSSSGKVKTEVHNKKVFKSSHRSIYLKNLALHV